MIIDLLLTVIIAIFNTVFWAVSLGGNKITELPFGVESTITTMMGYFHVISNYLPFLQTMYIAFLWYLTYRITIRLIAMIPFVRHAVSHIHSSTS